MTTTLEASYQPLQAFGSELGDVEETPHDSGVMIHVVPESSRARWNHMEDLDAFFTRMYHYHQKHGFACMMLQEVLELFQFVFVVVFSSFLANCVNYPVLFRDQYIANATHKVSLADAVIPTAQCVSSFSFTTWACLCVALIFWLLRVFKVVCHIFQFWDLKCFFNTALKISDSELDNLTWHEVQRRVREVQKEQQMCIHKTDLSELDIYHRILRFKNYMVAMVNKSLLPPRLQVPLLGEVVFLTHGLKYNLELLLFWGPWAPFENSWHLKEDYRKSAKRHELAAALSKHIMWLAIANLILCPLILLWQILYSFFTYAEIIKREPGSLGSRCWSQYGRLYLRHFNELDHELNARLNRAYSPASKYMNIFTSPLMTVIAKNVLFVAGAFLAVLVLLSVIDEDTLTVEHVITIITCLTAVVAACRALIPDENIVWCPETLMTAVLAHVHYLPDDWRGKAHKNSVRDKFSQLFPYRAVHLLEELLSPIITPFVLWFHTRPRALEFVDFYRNFTVEVVGVGDVCSFAQMDVRRHGNPTWHTSGNGNHKPSSTGTPAFVMPSSIGEQAVPCSSNQYTQAEDGKTELSLVHFTMTNPHWQPPPDAESFVDALRHQAKRDATGESGPAYPPFAAYSAYAAQIHSGSSLGPETSIMLSSFLRRSQAPDPQSPNSSQMAGEGMPMAMRGGLSRAEGPFQLSLHRVVPPAVSLGRSVFGSGVGSGFASEAAEGEHIATDMSLSTLLLHEVHHGHLRRRGGYQERESASRALWQRPHHEMAGICEEGPAPGSSGAVPGQTGGDRPAERTPLLTSKHK
ncbi:autophagy-related protein 9A [Thrips palmi]|uniref:Autophagy-related protein 9 n=1 Tax=Thrips palmi TaxID=161013 RepID=A0A6P8ZLQ5_THRPL|nr:autophagy-related protein 9A [Thrips palmi]